MGDRGRDGDAQSLDRRGEAGLTGVLGFLWRRLVTKPDRLTLSTEGVVILFMIAGLMVTELTYEAGLRAGEAGYGLALASLLIHLAIILAFLNVLPYGKHFHIITSLPNVFFARLPPAGALRKLDLESENASYGTATVKDLSWKEAWDTYSCTECGRCQTHCPTYVTGKPLSHKEVNRAIRHHIQKIGPDLVALVEGMDAVLVLLNTTP